MDAEGNITIPEGTPPEGPHTKPVLNIHYYGDIVRRLFLFGGAVMLAFIPFERSLIPINTFIIIIAILLFALLAGITNPKQKWITAANVAVASIALLIFEYYAITGFTSGEGMIVILARQLLALDFFFALYFASKTLRGAILKA